MPTMAIGAMRDRLVLQQSEPAEILTVSSLTRSGTTATATTAKTHGYATGDYVTIAGADQAYNGKVKITVTGTTSFTFTCLTGLTTPATGPITVVYASDAQGGRRTTWRTIDDQIAAELIPLTTSERLQRAAMQSETTYRFRIRSRTDLTTKQRVLWTPTWPPHAAEQSLEITGILPIEDGRTYAFLECSESPR